MKRKKVFTYIIAFAICIIFSTQAWGKKTAEDIGLEFITNPSKEKCEEWCRAVGGKEGTCEYTPNAIGDIAIDRLVFPDGRSLAEVLADLKDSSAAIADAGTGEEIELDDLGPLTHVMDTCSTIIEALGHSYKMILKSE